ncbi:hypothetical protein [Pseudomonas sp. S2_H10]|jgi:hypothetical protein
MLKKLIVSLALVSAPAWAVQPPFIGVDYSGRYQCTGQDSDIGAVLDMKLNAEQSTGHHGAYDFTLTLPNNAWFNGFAAANLSTMATYFAHSDPSIKDYGVGIAKIGTTSDGKISFTQYYYTPEYEGRGHGFQTCIKS